jgi:hypothetical protein
MAAESILGIIASTSSVLTALFNISRAISSINNAPVQARDVGREVDTLGGVMSCLKNEMEAHVGQPDSPWTSTATLTISSAQVTANELGQRVNGDKKKMGLWRRTKWAFNMTETARYCDLLRSYVHMMAMLRDGLQR